MLNIKCALALDMPECIARQCALLCWEGSEMQGVFNRIATHSLSMNEMLGKFAYAWYTPPDVDGYPIVVAGWVSLTGWQVGDRTVRQLQGYVAPRHRRCGIASALCVCLTHDMPKDELPEAVFSEEFFSIARRLRWRCTQYKRIDDGWIAVASFGLSQGGECGGGAVAAGIHAPPSEVRDLPLACNTAGEAP